jgi:predicted transport protein
MPIFKIESQRVKQIKATQFRNEKELQTLTEGNLEEIFGIRFIKTEHPTGAKHGGRIDTLGLDENNTPVIIEYKWGENDSVITQGLFYLDWLIDNKAEFQLLVQNKLGEKVEIDWSQPRLILLAASFNKYDKPAINRMAGNIELWTYSFYESGLLTIEMEASTQSNAKKSRKTTDTAYEKYDLNYHLDGTVSGLKEIFLDLKERVLQLPNVTELIEQKSGITYRTTKSFVRFEFKKNFIQTLLRDPKYNDSEKLVKDVTSFRWGYKGMVKILPTSNADYIFSLIKQSYEGTL